MICRILCSNKYAFTYNAHAKEYLTRFFEAIGYIYERQSQIMNVHNLIHLADDVQNMNCTLNNMSAFPFETLLGTIITSKCQSPTGTSMQTITQVDIYIGEGIDYANYSNSEDKSEPE